LISVINLILLYSLYADDIYKIYFDDEGIVHPGEPVLALAQSENPIIALSEYLEFSDFRYYTERGISYIAPTSGDGYIPVLSFHKLGEQDDFELTKERFEEFLIYLNANEFHIISDHQFLNEDYTRAVKGRKIVVLGSDDGSNGVFYYKTDGDLKTGNFLTKNGNFLISEESMVFYLNKYLPKENGHGNFTFYLTFDAIPFRQTGGFVNPGKPYLQMPAVRSKLHYLVRNYFIGNHTQNHLYTEELSNMDFTKELIGFYDIMELYDIDISLIKTLAYSFGIGRLSFDRKKLLEDFRYKGTSIAGAFDYDGYFSRPLNDDSVKPYDISRIGVDNKSFEKIMSLLKNVDIFESERAVLINSEFYPFDLSTIDLNKNDLNYILIRN
jgi:hypothetical protein